MTDEANRFAAVTDLRIDSAHGDTVIHSPDGVILCLGCRRLNRCRLGLNHESLEADGSVVSRAMCPPDHEGGPTVAHGGWIAALFDELVGHVMLLRNEFVVTRDLRVEFIKPVPIARPLIAITRIESRAGRDVRVASELSLEGGAVLGRASAHMVRRPAEHYERHNAWLQAQDDRIRSTEDPE